MTQLNSDKQKSLIRTEAVSIVTLNVMRLVERYKDVAIPGITIFSQNIPCISFKEANGLVRFMDIQFVPVNSRPRNGVYINNPTRDGEQLV